MTDQPIVCADCKSDLSGMAPILFASTETRFACLCPACAGVYSTQADAFLRLRAILHPESIPPKPLSAAA